MTRLRILGVMGVAAVLIGAASTTGPSVGVVAAATLPMPPISPVADAAMKGDLATLRVLIARGASVNTPQGDGMTALHWAAERGDAVMTGTLLRAKADVKAVTRIGGYTPLHIAAKGGHAAVVEALLKAGASANTATQAGATALHFAAAAGNAAAVSALVASGASVNAVDPEWGQTPLVFAAANDRGDAIRVLIKAGADASIHTRSMNLTEEAATEQAATRKRNEVLVSYEPEKHKDTVRAPAPGGADVPVPGFTGRAGAVAAVAPTAPVPVVEDAAGRGGRGGGRGGPPLPQPKGPFTSTQMQQAIEAGRVLYASAAAAKGPMREEVDTINGGIAGYVGSVGSIGGLSALHHAVRQGNINAVRALIEGGANINDVTGVDHTTPLLLATINGHFDVAMQLVAKGADPNLLSTAGLGPLYATINTMWAPRSRYPQPQDVQNQKTTHMELAEALLKAGAKPNERLTQQFWYFAYNNCGNANCGLENLEGTTPFWRAAYALDVDAMKLMLKYGADASLPSFRNPANAARAARAGRGGPGAPGGQPAGAGVDPLIPFQPAGAAGGGGGRGGFGGPPVPPLDPATDSASKAVPPGIGVYAVHAVAGVGYGNGFAGNSHRHAPDAWMPAMRFIVEELHADVNQRDQNGYTPLHHAAARGDNEMILYLVSKGADVKAVARNGRTTVDMANGPVQRLSPLPETIALLEKLGAKNSHRCVTC